MDDLSTARWWVEWKEAETRYHEYIDLPYVCVYQPHTHVDRLLICDVSDDLSSALLLGGGRMVEHFRHISGVHKSPSKQVPTWYKLWPKDDSWNDELRRAREFMRLYQI